VIQISSLINKYPPDYDNSPTSTLEEGNRPNFRDKLKKRGVYVQPLLTRKTSITYSKCVFVALVIQHAKRMRLIIFSSMACLAVPSFFFPRYFINSTHAEKKERNIEHKMCVVVSSTNFVRNISHPKEN